MTAKTPADQVSDRRSDAQGVSGAHGQGGFVESARRNQSRTDQHFAARSASASETPDPFGEGGFAGGGDHPDGSRQSGYGADYGQLQPSQRHEKQASERDYGDDRKKGGTVAESNR